VTRPSNPRLRAIDHAIETIDLARTLLPQALDRARDARRGYPRSSLGGGGRSAGAHSDTTAAAATEPDPGGDAIRELDAIARRIEAVAREMHAWVTRWAPRPPSTRALRETEAANVVECASCRAHGFHAPMSVHSDASGTLAHPMALCRWCADFARSQGVLPTQAQAIRHHKGLRVRISA